MSSHRKRIVLSLDGTWNNPSQRREREPGMSWVYKPTNALKMARAVSPGAADGRVQLTYYDAGVGALGDYPGRANRLLRATDTVLGGTFGAGFEGNVAQALTFLAHNHGPDDEVYLFGFSRGAAAARAVTRFVDWLGGLPAKRDVYYLPLFFEQYLEGRATPEVPEKCGALKPVEFALLAVWDTVLALAGGVIGGRHLGETPARCVRHAMQALAIDERRYDFRPEIWQAPAEGRTLEQRWFAGSHSGVGGGYAYDGLANIALDWVADAAEARGLELDRGYLKYFRKFAQDKLTESDGRFWQTIEDLRRVTGVIEGDGRRSLLGHPASAQLSVDKSVLWRLQAEPGEVDDKGQTRWPNLKYAYLPENVLQFLKAQKDLAAFLAPYEMTPRQFPERVLRAIGWEGE